MKKAFQNLLRNYFNFTRGERNAFFVLSGLTFIIAVLPAFDFGRKPEIPDFSRLEKMAELKAAAAAQDSSKQYNKSDYSANKKYPAPVLKAFNPNTATEQELIQLGFKPWLAKRVIKYRNAGGRFKTKSDINHIYGLDPAFTASLMPYIELPETTATTSGTTSVAPAAAAPRYTLINLNTADTAQLNRLKGIGHKLSQRIIAFREKLGGFYSIEQLKEVYGLQPEVIESFQPRLAPDLKPYRMIALNTATADELGKHPYIGRKNAAVIVNYREQHGPYNKTEDLLKLKVIDELTLLKLKNYLNL